MRLFHNGARCTDIMRVNPASKSADRLPPLFLTVGAVIAFSSLPYSAAQEQAP
ncbi:hypothetical protein Pvag_1061 [Pantoea vagans C9-1]|nr:hypothetical protein Pvag_1061 [Pantoea vagans C9-1]